jgi:steroid delta-isomerase
MAEQNFLKALMAQHRSLADLMRSAVFQTSSKPTREHMERAARIYLATYLNGDLATRASLFAEDAVFEDPVGAQPLRGMAQIMPFWKQAHEAGWWCGHDLRSVVVSGQEVMLHMVSHMSLPGLEPATMEVFESQAFNDAGKIVHLKAYFDAGGLGKR